MNQRRSHAAVVDGMEIGVFGRFLKTARMHGEYYDFIDDAECFLQKLKTVRLNADLFTFLQQIGEPIPKYPYPHEPESLAVLPITTYEHWWKKQINDKTRNMIRKAQKGGVDLRVCTLDETFVRAIMEIYNECPLRQGKRFKHYGKDFQTVQNDHASYLERSDFIGAFQGEEMIGFIKLVHGRNASSLMQIISKIAWRDKASTNALIAKAVEVCAAKGISYLHYGIWSRRGIGEFKKHHGFLQQDIPRYYVPLNLRGRLALKLSLHRKLISYIPETAQDRFASLRSRWNQFHYRKQLQERGSSSMGRAS
ncbi:MAG: hypothetical protein NTZ46_08030 [Verrucomicrobia bacterium]|nr:hypothetical protein [Verrucomicrobiota bacterium]